MTYLAMPQHKNPCPWGHEIFNFGRALLIHHYYILSFSEPCPLVEKIFKTKTSILHFLHPKITSPCEVCVWGGGGGGNKEPGMVSL